MDIMTLSLVIAIATFAVGYFCAMPSERKVWVAIGVQMVWFSLYLAERIPIADTLLRYRLVPIAMVCCASIIHPRFRLGHVPKSAVAYLSVALAAISLVHGVVDFHDAVSGRVYWAMTILSALAVAKFFQTEYDLRPLISTIGAAGGIFTVICLTDIALHPVEAFEGAYTRYAPWGINPNAIGPIVVFGIAGMYVSILHNPRLRLILLPLIASSIGLILLTASRGTLTLLGFALVPVLLLGLKRHRVATGITLAAIYFGGTYIWESVDASRFDRLASLDSSRAELRILYWQEVMQRPFFGLLTADGATANTLHGIQLDEHNAYLRLLYLGGLALFIPVVALSVLSMMRGIRAVWWSRTTPKSTVETTMLMSFFAGIFVFGYTNRLMYEPQGYLPFLHALLMCVFLKIGARPSSVSPQGSAKLSDDAVQGGRAGAATGAIAIGGVVHRGAPG
jgi:hypothetical protein